MSGVTSPQIVTAETDQGTSFGSIPHTALMFKRMSKILILCLIDNNFPKSHVLHKIFNRNYVKVSYSCMSNMARIIKSHKAKILGKVDASSASDKQCNCRKKDLCPLDGACLTNNIVYKATVTAAPGDAKVYIGMTENSVKTRSNNHKVSFKHRKHPHDTVLSKYIWDLKDSDTDLISQSSGRLSRVRDLTGEIRHAAIKLCILSADKSTLLNKRSELITKCRHENKFYAANQKRDRFTHRP